MKRRILFCIAALWLATMVNAQTALKKVYNEAVNPLEQIDQALVKAKADGKFVVCQVGGNWCPWCLRFADFITNDTTISKLISDNFEYIHVNYNPRKSESAEKAAQAAALMTRLNNCGRTGSCPDDSPQQLWPLWIPRFRRTRRHRKGTPYPGLQFLGRGSGI